MNNYWHVYPREQIKPTLAGDAVYTLAIPSGGDASVKGFQGKALRYNRIAGLPESEQDASVFSYPYGIIFDGVNHESIEDLEEPESLVELAAFEVPCHNQQLISNAKNLFLSRSSVPKGVDPLTFCLLQGLTHLLPSFRSFPRVPITSLPRPTNQRGILIVEDEEAQLELFRLVLESLGYNNIYQAQDGTEALPILKARGNEIDLIVLNWEMPRMDGLTLMRHLAHSYPHTVGVLMESGYPHNEFKREFFKLGTNSVLPIDYLVKPFLLDEFALEVRVAMEFVRRRKLRCR
jgi:two-component system, chemotaxis family, chemotaxis protein CheY